MTNAPPWYAGLVTWGAHSIPVIAVVGRREADEGKVALRRLGSDGQQIVTLDEAAAMLAAEATPPDLR